MTQAHPFRIERVFKHLRLVLAAVVALVGVGFLAALALTPEGFVPKFMVFFGALFAGSLLAMFLPWEGLRIAGTWSGIALVILALSVRPSLLGTWYPHLPSNMKRQIDVRDGVPGIKGLQTITTDTLGFRVTPPVDYERKRGPRIFAIGASTTADVWLDDRKTWTHLLQRRLQGEGIPAEVINTGVEGLRAQQNVATLEFVSGLKGDMVAFLLGINDWNNHIRNHFRPSLERYGITYNPTETWLWDLTKVAVNVKRWVKSERFAGWSGGKAHAGAGAVPGRVEVSYGDYFSKQNDSLARPDRRSFRPAQVRASYLADLQELSRMCRAARLACVFATQPTGYRPEATAAYRKSFWMTPLNESYTLDFASLVHIAALYNETLRDFARANGHPICDLAAQLPPSHAVFYDDVHFNEAGARRVAELMQACIRPLLHAGSSARSERLH